MNRASIRSLGALAALLLVAGCTLPTGIAPGPRVWIDDPLDGAYLPLAAVIVRSHASWETGTASAALLVNGAQVRVDIAADPSDPLAAFAQPWAPTEVGDYTLQVVATDKGGHAGRSNPVLVHIGAEFVSTVTSGTVETLPPYEPPPTNTPPPTISVTITLTNMTGVNPALRFTSNANCREGPSTDYPVVTSFHSGDEVPIQGRNEDASWFWLFVPNSKSLCAAAGSTGVTVGPAENAPFIPAPVLPATTVAPPPVEPPTLVPPPLALAAPGKFSVSDKSCTASGYIIVLKWTDVSNEDGYRIYRDGKLIATLPANSTSYDDTSPDNNPHVYYAEAYNASSSATSPSANSKGCLY